MPNHYENQIAYEAKAVSCDAKFWNCEATKGAKFLSCKDVGRLAEVGNPYSRQANKNRTSGTHGLSGYNLPLDCFHWGGGPLGLWPSGQHAHSCTPTVFFRGVHSLCHALAFDPFGSSSFLINFT